MKKDLLTFIIAVVSITLGFCAFLHFTEVFRDKDEVGKNKALIAAKSDEYDVFFLGSSHVGPIQPALLWEEYGITSYNLYNKGDGMDRCLAVLELAFDYVKPELVVIDTDKWWSLTTFEEKPAYFHSSFDIFPLSLHKVKLVNKLCEDPEARKELIFDFYRYHSRYSDLTPDDFKGYDDNTLGANLHYESLPFSHQDIISPDEMPEDEDNDESMLRSIIEFCLDEGVDVMLMTLPYPAARTEDQRRYNAVKTIADEYGIFYENFIPAEGLVDYSYDFRDSGHLNLSGGKKITSAIGGIIKDRYNLADHREDEKAAHKWDDIRKGFDTALDDTIGGPLITELREALVLMSMDHYSGEIYIKNSEKGYLDREGTVDLIERVAGCKLPVLRKSAKDHEDYLLIFNRNMGSIQEFGGDEIYDVMGDAGDLDSVYITFRNEDSEYIDEYREE